MANVPMIVTAIAYEGAGAQCMARILGNDAAVVTQASVTSGAYEIYNANTGTVTTASAAIVVATDFFNTLQTGARWTNAQGVGSDTTGYNFLHTVLASELTDGGVVYFVKCTFVMASGEDIKAVYKLSTVEMLGE